MWFLGMDVGTGGTRAVVVDGEGKPVAGASSEHAAFKSAHPGWAEQDPEDWWRAAQEAIALGQGSGRTTNPGYQTTPTYGTGTTNYYDFGGDTGTPSQTPQISYNQPTTGQFDYLTGGQGPVTSATAATGQQDAYSQLQNILTGGDFSYLNPAS